MAQAVTYAATIVGVEAQEVEVQADVSSGLPSFQLVGLGDAAVLEARERVRAAIRASGFEFPLARVVVNLAPAPLRKHGTGFDLPIALALLVATGQVSRQLVEGAAIVGELALDGSIRPTGGLLAHAVAATKSGRRLVGPAATTPLADAVQDLRYHPLSRLAQLRQGLPPITAPGLPARPAADSVADFVEVAGQEIAKRVLEISAAGGHNVLFIGPPGSGKTMLARRLPGILPPLNDVERLETAIVHSVAGLDEAPVLDGIRPFRAPHHTCSVAGLVGGGSPPRPGEASLAHNGVLFLDELPEFGPAALQTLRQPLEDRALTLVRAEGRVEYPAAFTLVAAMNPCPCGYFGDAERHCECGDARIAKYRSRVGGPLMDRIDLCVRVDRIDPRLLVDAASPPETSATVRARVLAAREFAARRRGGKQASELAGKRLQGWNLDAECIAYVVEAASTYRLSGRAVTRLLRVARTIADLEACERVTSEHLMEAVGYRSWEVS